MSSNVKLYQSTDTGAPGLTGQAGSLIALLDALLVDGYNSGAATITRSGSTATATRTGHGFQEGACVLHEGADQAEYNGEVYIFNVTPDTYDFTVSGTPATPATGTITVKKAPAGWTKAYSGTNKVAYRQGGGNLRYLRVDDAGAGSAMYARVVGFEDMTDVDTGTGQFPTNAQVSGGLYWSKSSTTDSTSRPWVSLATDKHLYLFVNANSVGTGGNCFVAVFADLKSYKPGDVYNTLIVGGTNTSTISNNNFHTLSGSISTMVTGHYVSRSYTQTGASTQVGKHSDSIKGSSSALGASGLTYPHPVDGGLYMAPIYIQESGYVRGALPGIWNPLHTRPLNHLDTFDGSGELAGRSFMAFSMYLNAQAFLETSNTWNQ